MCARANATVHLIFIWPLITNKCHIASARCICCGGHARVQLQSEIRNAFWLQCVGYNGKIDDFFVIFIFCASASCYMARGAVWSVDSTVLWHMQKLLASKCSRAHPVTADRFAFSKMLAVSANNCHIFSPIIICTNIFLFILPHMAYDLHLNALHPLTCVLVSLLHISQKHIARLYDEELAVVARRRHILALARLRTKQFFIV